MVRNILYSFIIILFFVSNSHGTNNPNFVDIDFDNAPLQEVIFTISDYTGAGFVWSASDDIKISWSEKNIYKLRLIQSFNDVLSSYGLTSYPLKFRKNFYSIQSTSQITSGSESQGVYFLKFIKAESLKDTLQNMYGNRLSYSIFEDNNSIFFTATPQILISFTEYLEKIDRPSLTNTVSTYNLKHIPVKEAYTTLKSMESETDILPDYWNHSIIIRGSLQDISDIRKALSSIDVEQQGIIDEVAFISSIETEQATQVLSELYPEVKIKPVSTHKLIFSGKAKEVNTALGMLQKMDGSNYQVKVEAIIASLSDTEFYELGIKLAAQKKYHTNINLNNSFDSLITSHSGLLIDYFTSFLNIKLSAQDGLSHGEILSSPVLTVLNGQTARLHVGQNVPFIKKALQDDQENKGIEIERHDVGVNFEITPSIDPKGEFVHLKVNQVVSSVQPESENTSQAADIITDKKELMTTVMVADGDTIFLGGLKSDELGTSTDKVPFLGEIPIIGNAFTYQSDKKVTRHLVISLRLNVIKRT